MFLEELKNEVRKEVEKNKHKLSAFRFYKDLYIGFCIYKGCSAAVILDVTTETCVGSAVQNECLYADKNQLKSATDIAELETNPEVSEDDDKEDANEESSPAEIMEKDPEDGSIDEEDLDEGPLPDELEKMMQEEIQGS